ncbi:SH3 domain-containing protein [Bradyrhizobium sp. I1.7.5]|uniref:SH3 domain-containing protein n=1 Tax=Bradyrhizobium sp. I1.7.5 TaxID=3156363 RepID=UPI00339480C8
MKAALVISIATSVLVQTTACPAQTRPPEPAATLIDLWADANGRCRGGSGDSAKTDAACAERERLGERLDGLDWCYGKRGQIGAEMQWHGCVSSSLRPERATANCVIADPTSTPLNVRTGPNGKIIGTVPNGDRANVIDQAVDRSGERWVYIADVQGQPLGWVFRRYLVCRN